MRSTWVEVSHQVENPDGLPYRRRDRRSTKIPIPAFTPDGLLPEGIYDCTVEELRRQFGSFQVTD